MACKYSVEDQPGFPQSIGDILLTRYFTWKVRIMVDEILILRDKFFSFHPITKSYDIKIDDLNEKPILMSVEITRKVLSAGLRDLKFNLYCGKELLKTHTG